MTVRNTFSAAGKQTPETLRRAINSALNSIVRQINAEFAADTDSGGGGVNFTIGYGINSSKFDENEVVAVDSDVIANRAYVNESVRVYFVGNASQFDDVPQVDSTRLFTTSGFTAGGTDFDSETFYIYSEVSSEWVNVGSQSGVTDLLNTKADISYVDSEVANITLTRGYGIKDDENTWSVDTDVIADTDWVLNQTDLRFFHVNNVEGASGAISTGTEGISIGPGARARGTRSFAIGDDSQTLSGHTTSIAFGDNAVTSAANQMRISSVTHVRMDNDYVPENDYDLANKKYVDDNSSGLSEDEVNIYADSDHVRISTDAPTLANPVANVLTITYTGSNPVGYSISVYNLDGSEAHQINVTGGRSPQQQAFDLSSGINGSSAPISASRTDNVVTLTWDDAGAIQGDNPSGISYSNSSFSTVVVTTAGSDGSLTPPDTFYTEMDLGTGLTNDGVALAVNTETIATRSWVTANTDNNVFIKADFVDTASPAQTNDSDTIAIGSSSHADSRYAIAIGFRAGGADSGDSTGDRSVCLGYETEANGTNSVAVGPGPAADGDNSIAIGRFSTAGHSNSVAIGQNASTDANGQITFDGDNARGLSLPTASSDPSGMPDGTIYYRTGDNKLRLRANGSWVSLN